MKSNGFCNWTSFMELAVDNFKIKKGISWSSSAGDRLEGSRFGLIKMKTNCKRIKIFNETQGFKCKHERG